MNYKKEALRTNTPDREAIKGRLSSARIQDLLHSALGVASECLELKQAFDKADRVNIIEECGDLAWFLNIALKETYDDNCYFKSDSLFFNQTNTNQNILSLKDSSLHFIDKLKGAIFYGKELLEEDVIMFISGCFFELNQILFNIGSSIEEACTKNIEKLKKRYPDGFTEEKAINRNTQAEREVLEK